MSLIGEEYFLPVESWKKRRIWNRSHALPAINMERKVGKEGKPIHISLHFFSFSFSFSFYFFGPEFPFFSSSILSCLISTCHESPTMRSLQGPRSEKIKDNKPILVLRSTEGKKENNDADADAHNDGETALEPLNVRVA
jgi:hypothetical protein